MRLTILGAGTGASGLPNAAQYPPGFLVEWADPAGDSGQQKILFDCSEGVRFRLAQAGHEYSQLHHVAITHPHPDHNVFLQFLQAVYLKWSSGGEQFKNPELHLYAPRHIIGNMDQQWDLLWQTPGPRYYKSPALKLHVMPDESALIGNGKLSAAKVYHESGNSDAVAFRLETPEGIFAYSGDTGDCPGIRQVCRDVDIFVCEDTARIGQEEKAIAYGHLTPRQAGEIAKDGKVKKLIFFHYTGQDSHQAMIDDCRLSGFSGEVVIGEDFQVFEI
jgi:ribonuclease Z